MSRENAKVPSDSFGVMLCVKVLADFEEKRGRELIRAYEHTWSKLQQDVYENIRSKEPSLTDHGATHVSNVKDNVISLLCENGAVPDLTGVEMYCLGMLVLFHDAGNVYGRNDHHNKVARVFDRIRGTGAALRREKTLIVRAARAHTGTAQDGSHDTLKELGNNENLEGRPVRLREIAAILRFADELAEGPQRTSDFMQSEGLYDRDSEIFHDYASSTHIFIDRALGRIVATYEIDLRRSDTDETRRTYLAELLTLAYKRLVKLDQERQYARHYSRLLGPFRSTEAKFNFHCAGDVLDIDMLPLKLTDMVVIPGQNGVDVSTMDRAYDIEKLVSRLISECPGESRS